MFTSVRIKSVEYYRQQSEISRKENLQYYTDNGANPDEAEGRWWSPFDPDKFPHSPISSFERFVVPGSTVDTKTLMDLSKGLDPLTGKTIVQQNGKPRSVGFDCQLSAPKSVSVLWGLARAARKDGQNSDEGKRVADMIEEAHRAANDRAMKYAYDQSLIVTRTKGAGKVLESAGDIAAAQYMHHTSRAGDMQLHTHNVIMNVCRREDGATGTLDNKEMLRYQGAIAAVYRAELASILKRELGVTVVKDDRNFKVSGVSDELEATFSKRRNTILKTAEEMGFDGTANNREAAIHINRNTRQEKSEQPPLIELQSRWNMEAQAKGWNFVSVMESVEMATAKAERDAVEEWEQSRKDATANGEVIPAERPPYDFEEIKARAFEKLTQFHSTFEDRTLCKEIFEELQIHCNADEAISLLEEIKATKQLVEVGRINSGRDAVYSTPEIIERERTMLQRAVAMKGNLESISNEIVEKVIAAGRPVGEGDDRAPLRAEQANAVRHILAGDQVAVMEGRAGAGKSFTLGAVTDAAHMADLQVHGLAPSWKATGVLKEDTKIAEEYARAITGWLNAVDRGEIAVDGKTLIIVDEAGMVGLDHMSRLVELTEVKGARLVLAGDTRQLQPVTAGAPMKAIASLNGSAVLAEIARQKVEWQRNASIDFSNGKAEAALSEYSKFGNIRLNDDGEEAMKALVKDYMTEVDAKPKSTRLILTTTNADATAINNAVRAEQVERGALTGSEIVIETVSRGKNGRLTELGLMKGDRVILGETLDIGGRKYINNSTGTLIDIRVEKGSEPILTIRWDDGRTLEATTRELVGYREEGSKEAHAPKIAHAYAMTVHASQGQTVDSTFVYNARGLGLESTYVAMTRHRYDAKMYVDTSRIVDELSTNGGVKFSVTPKKGKTKQDDGEGDTVVTTDMIKEKLFKECAKSEAKLNVCDFQADVRAWISPGKSEPLAQGGSMNSEHEQIESKRPIIRPSPFAVNFTPKGLGAVGRMAEQPSRAAEDTKKRMEERSAVTAPKSAPAKPAQSNRLTPNEVHTLVTQNLAQYMIDDGAKQTDKPRETPKGMEYSLSFGKGQGVVVTEFQNGNWSFFTRDRSASGDIRNYVEWRDGLSFGQASHKLREEFGTKENSISAPSFLKDRQPRPEETMRQKFDRLLSDGYVAEKFAKIRSWWGEASEAVSGYLTGRGITKEVQAEFRKDFRCEGAETYDGKNKKGVMFAMRDQDGNLTGFVRKGQKARPTDERSFSSNAEGTERHLVIMGDTTAPKRVYVGEAPIDGMSLYQRDGRPEGSLILATAGSAPERGLAQVYKVAKENPNAQWYWVGQNDDLNPKTGLRADEVNEGKVREAINEGNPAAKIETRRPPEQFKDWNDELRGIERKKSAPVLSPQQEAARQKAKAEQEARKERIAAEMAARQREEEERKRGMTR